MWTELFLSVVVASAVACCHSTQTQPTTPSSDAMSEGGITIVVAADSGVLDPCSMACMNLAAIGCPEGRPDEGGIVSCTDVCQKTQRMQLTDLRPACLLRARNKVEARACGTVACP